MARFYEVAQRQDSGMESVELRSMAQVESPASVNGVPGTADAAAMPRTVQEASLVPCDCQQCRRHECRKWGKLCIVVGGALILAALVFGAIWGAVAATRGSGYREKTGTGSTTMEAAQMINVTSGFSATTPTTTEAILSNVVNSTPWWHYVFPPEDFRLISVDISNRSMDVDVSN